ncbi:MAG TPA: hypothetical protein ENH82_11180 [bacterium]|nr:hypothetical protein [bacterium]
MANLIITLKKGKHSWLAKFSDEPILEFFPVAFTNNAPVEKVIKRLSGISANRKAEYIIED